MFNCGCFRDNGRRCRRDNDFGFRRDNGRCCSRENNCGCREDFDFGGGIAILSGREFPREFRRENGRCCCVR